VKRKANQNGKGGKNLSPAEITAAAETASKIMAEIMYDSEPLFPLLGEFPDLWRQLQERAAADVRTPAQQAVYFIKKGLEGVK